MLKRWREIFTKDHNKYSIALILIGIITWSLTMVRSGLVYNFGMGFWGPNGHDGVWHVALANSLARGSWDMPVFAGEALKNYHVGFDLILAMLHKLTFIPIYNLYFQILPPIMAFLIGLLVYKLVLAWKKSKTMALWATFFVYFGGSFGWIITFLRDGVISGESVFWSQQAISTLINPPFAMSLVFIFAGVLLLLNLKGSRNKTRLFLATMVFGILIQIKVYAGILVLGGLFTAGIFQIFKKREFALFKVFSGALLVSILLFFPLNNSSNSLIELKPFWFLEGMMGFPDRVGWLRYYSAMTNYVLGGVWHKAIFAYLGAFIIFLIGNMSIRVVGFIEWIRLLKKPSKISWIDVFFVSIVLAGIIFPMLFVQKGNPWNTIQFFYYSLVFMGIYSGIFIARALKKYSKQGSSAILLYGIAVLLILILIPTSVSTLWYHYLAPNPQAKIASEELEALTFLSNQPEGVVLTLPFDKNLADEALSNPPRPLYLYESTAYISAFSKKPTYLEDELNLIITDYDWHERRESVENFLTSFGQNNITNFLRDENITYVYWNKDTHGDVRLDLQVMRNIFENNTVAIYRVI